MPLWRFRQYVTNWNEWPFRDWYNAQDPHVRAGFDATREILAAAADWLEPETDWFKVFTGPDTPLSEIRYRAYDRDRGGKAVRTRRIRPIGLYRPHVREFILFAGAEEAGRGKYTPADALTKAKRRYSDFMDDKGMLYDLD
jgi:hypothetical protein